MGNLQVVAPSSFKNTTCNNATIPPEFSPILELHDMYDLFACVLTVCGLVGLINYHRLKFPLPPILLRVNKNVVYCDAKIKTGGGRGL